jgi:fluoroquinolone transport system permease protein
MNSFLALFSGELQRMKKYNILSASLFIALLWIGVLHFTGIEDVSTIFPLLIFLDATSMAILIVGVSMFFEKQEGALKSLLVSPITKGEYLLAKTFANIASNIFTLGNLYLYARIFKEIDLSIAGLVGAVVLIAFFHSMLGVILTYYSKDFTELLMGMMKYAFIFMIPVLLVQVGLITNEAVKTLLYLVPTKAAMTLLNASKGGVALWEVLLSTAYLLIASFGIYVVVLKKFNQFAIKESGV